MFNKTDLKYQNYYQWSSSNMYDEKKLSINDPFSKFDGYYTLALVNHIAEKLSLSSIKDCHMLEDAISVSPDYYGSTREIVQWVEEDIQTMKLLELSNNIVNNS